MKKTIAKTLGVLHRWLPGLIPAPSPKKHHPKSAPPQAPAKKRHATTVAQPALPKKAAANHTVPKFTHVNQFVGLGIADTLLHQVEKLGFHTPTPIQKETIPTAILGKDIVGIAQTGTGKTLAFGIPLIQKLTNEDGLGLILAPTRELAVQIEEAILPFAKAAGLSTVVMIGGANMRAQIERIRKSHPRILIATPGRLIDLMEQGVVQLGTTKVLVLDEADRMLDMGFAPQIARILRKVPVERQTMLFSATMPQEIVKISASYMRSPERIEVARAGTAAEHVTQELFVVSRQHKAPLLEKLLHQYHGSVLLFTRTRRGAERVTEVLRRAGHKVEEIHSDRSMGQRIEALEGFKAGKYRVLVATDIAARGIDVTGIELVVNYDMPDDPENYVHRIGRTGRAGRKGHTIGIATPDQGSIVKAIEWILGVSIPVSVHPDFPSAEFSALAGLHPSLQILPSVVREKKETVPKPVTDWGRQPHAGRGKKMPRSR